MSLIKHLKKGDDNPWQGSSVFSEVVDGGLEHRFGNPVKPHPLSPSTLGKRIQDDAGERIFFYINIHLCITEGDWEWMGNVCAVNINDFLSSSHSS